MFYIAPPPQEQFAFPARHNTPARISEPRLHQPLTQLPKLRHVESLVSPGCGHCAPKTQRNNMATLDSSSPRDPNKADSDQWAIINSHDELFDRYIDSDPLDYNSSSNNTTTGDHSDLSFFLDVPGSFSSSKSSSSSK